MNKLICYFLCSTALNSIAFLLGQPTKFITLRNNGAKKKTTESFLLRVGNEVGLYNWSRQSPGFWIELCTCGLCNTIIYDVLSARFRFSSHFHSLWIIFYMWNLHDEPNIFKANSNLQWFFVCLFCSECGWSPTHFNSAIIGFFSLFNARKKMQLPIFRRNYVSNRRNGFPSFF